MSFYNNQSKDFNLNSGYNYLVQTDNTRAQSSYSHSLNMSEPAGSQVVDISYSTLEPTAQEFYPSNQGISSVNGAVKKNLPSIKSKYRDNGRRNNKYGSGRTFNWSNRDYMNKNERSINSQEQSKHLQDAASFLRNSNQEKSDNITEESVSGSSNYSIKMKLPQENRSSEYYQPKNFFRDNDYQERQKNYGNKSRDNENLESTFESLKVSIENQSYSRNYKSNRRTYDKTNRTDNYGRYDKSNHFYYNSEKNGSYYDRHNRNNSYNKSEKNISNNYCDRSSYYNNFHSNNIAMAKSEKSNKIQYGGKNGHEQVVEDDHSTNFRLSLKPYETNKSYNRYGERKDTRDWRKSSNENKDHVKAFTMKRNKKFDAASQRERLEEMISCRLLECLVCCEKIKNADKVWNCMQCYHILHLTCVAAWAKSSKVENGWRCPACQNVCTDVPKRYMCYCGKTADPRYDSSIIPHGCGDICLRKGRMCEHKCTILCHPGPCPDCNVMVTKPCGCGSTEQIVKCSTDIEIVCNSTCNKTLNCGIHKCKSICHPGSCSPCGETINQECYCGKVGRKVPCSAEIGGNTQYACEDICGKKLSCGNHICRRICHVGLCDPCIRDVSIVHTCPCGKTPLEKPRTSCLEIIACCDKICGKLLHCGQTSSPHRCRELCHEGQCPPCPLTTVVRCRCGHMDKELPCQEVTTKADDARCEKKCTKKRMCGKHRCNQRCCIEIEHFCPLPCNHQLSCGQHRCERTCHSGRCLPCTETSFDELYCECGASVLYPPIPCGTKPPVCSEPCSRQRPCGHDVNHNCHTGACPPCTVLCKRWCHGHHEERSAIPCHQENFSCGLPCGKPMPCKRHKCNKPCHEGLCPIPCKQPCNVRRNLCGHPCGKPCHDPPCPESSCKQNVSVTCLCGLQKSIKPCIEVSEEFRNIELAQLKEKMGTTSKDQTIDISDIVSKPKKPTVLKILECNEECRVYERNRRLAIGLQIRNPDLSQKLTPRYTDYMKQWAKKDPHFCQRVHDKLTELVQLAKQSKQKSRSYSFESMNRDKRHFIHEYCEHFGVESAAYDMEPNRNIVATAIKDKSWLPSMSLLEVIQRESGQRKVPGPVSVLSKSTVSKSEIVSLKLPTQRPITHPGEIIDYFDPPV